MRDARKAIDGTLWRLLFFPLDVGEEGGDLVGHKFVSLITRIVELITEYGSRSVNLSQHEKQR